jgi:hypothetical protein
MPDRQIRSITAIPTPYSSNMKQDNTETYKAVNSKAIRTVISGTTRVNVLTQCMYYALILCMSCKRMRGTYRLHKGIIQKPNSRNNFYYVSLVDKSTKLQLVKSQTFMRTISSIL